MANKSNESNGSSKSSEDPAGSFGHGIAVGVGLSALLVHIAVLGLGSDWSKLYSEMGHIELPVLTRITISPVWQLGVPIAGLLAVSALILKRPRSLAIYIGVAALMILCTAASIYGPTIPINALAGSIQP